jgi:conjugative transposon TraM protein
MTLDLKKPKYALPIILLPFILLLFYSYKSSFGKPVSPKNGSKDSLQTVVAGVSSQIKSQNLSDKLAVLRQHYGHSDGPTAVNGIAEQVQPVSRESQPDYNQSEKHTLDSIGAAVGRKYGGRMGIRSAEPVSSDFYRASNWATSKNYIQQDRSLKATLAKINQSSPGPYRGQVSAAADPMQLFRQQMALIDSIGKAGDKEYRDQNKNRKLQSTGLSQPAETPSLPVSKVIATSSVFNTIATGQNELPITAVVDQDITAYAGSRLRIRLLEDILAGGVLIRAGTYLYAQASGFSGQRINLSVNSILQGGHILAVKLELYDTDGLPGLYVPSSAFRDFTKDLGSDATGVSLEQQGASNEQVISLLGKMFQSTTTAVGKLIRQNKATLKYQTLVYLIDPAEMHARAKNQ